MADFIKAGRVGDISKGSIKTFVVNGKHVAIARIEDQYFAIDDICSHDHCSLGSEGFMDGNEIICGCHGSKFDMTTGKVKSLPATVDVSSYEVKVDGDYILIAI
jgi:nitrite reductase/ring-hydroxylating ferredoxin subunit